jgi:hypothetical protein
MGLPAVVDTHFPTYDHWQDLRLGGVLGRWCSAMVSEGDHRRHHLAPWIAHIAVILRMCAWTLALADCAGETVRLPVPLQGDYVALTCPIIALGDTQEHEATGFPLHNNDGAVDAYVEVAQRPPEQPLFGRPLLEWAIESHPDAPMVHLGGVLDLSCRSELVRMQKIFEVATQPGAILPGNHDGLLFGIFNYDFITDRLSAGALQWRRGCRQGAGPEETPASADGRGPGLNKRQFLAAYLEALAVGPQPQAGLTPPAASGTTRVSWRNPDPHAFLAGIEAHLVDGRQYARSFIVQKLRLPAAPQAPRRVTMVAIDTNQLNVAIGMLNMLFGRSPGTTGHVLDDQVRRIAQMIDEARRAGEIVVLAGHHNWALLDGPSRRQLAAILERLAYPLVYVSAHTHQGFWAQHRLRGRSLLELNVSSLSDWPLAYRRVAFAYDGRANRLQVSGELLPRGEASPQDDAELLQAWANATCSQVGVPQERLAQRDLEAVRSQRMTRGTLVGWLLKGQGEWCEWCRQRLYASAHRYQDGLLDVIAGLYDDPAGEVPELEQFAPPAFCAGQSLRGCVAALRAAPYDDLASTIAVFRQKAALVDALGVQLDDLAPPRVKAYMTCRAALAAKDDYDLTPEKRRSGDSEAVRRRPPFFQTEATVGME